MRSNTILVILLIGMIWVQAITIQIGLNQLGSIQDVKNEDYKDLYFNNNTEQPTISNPATIKNSTSKYSENTFQDSKVSQHTPQLNSIDTSTCIQGESVRVDFVPPDVLASSVLGVGAREDTILSGFYTLSGTVQAGTVSDTFSEDSFYLVSSWDGSYSIEGALEVFIDLAFYTGGLGGTLSWVAKTYSKEPSSVGGSETSVNWAGSTAISSYYVGADNRIIVRIEARLDAWNSRHYLKIKVMSPQTGDISTLYSNYLSIPSTSIQEVDIGKILIDQIKFSPSSLTAHVRSSYKYTSETQLVHKLSIENSIAGATINIYAPMAWNFSSITPLATVSYDSANKYWSLTNTFQTNYEIFFVSGDGWGVDYVRKPQLLALREVSSDYAQRGFETGTFENWEEWGASVFTEKSLKTDIVFEGSFSMFLKSSTTAWVAQKSRFPDGYYYVSFAAYFPSGVSTALDFGVTTSSSTIDWYNLDESVTDRWQQYFYYVWLGGEYSGGAELWFKIFYGEVYIDNFRIYKASTTLSTTGLNEYSISGQLVSWDNRQNPPMPNSLVQVQLRDRTENTLIQSWSDVETDSTGSFSVTYTGSLSQKEYELRVWNWDSWFGTPWTINEFLDLDFWGGGYMATYVETQENDYIKITWNAQASHAGGLGYIWFTPLNYDTSSADAYYWETYSIGSFDYSRAYFVEYWSGTQYAYYNYPNDPTSWEQIKVTKEDMVLHPTWDQTWGDVWEYMLWYGWNTTSATVDTYFRDFHAINAQKTFFTPLPASQSLYQYEEENEWDWSENCSETETFVASGNLVSYSTSYENGVWRIHTQWGTSLSYGFIRFRLSFSVNYDIYDTVQMRIRVNDTSYGTGVYIRDETGTISTPWKTLISTSFTVYAISISQTGVHEFHIGLRWDDSAGGNFSQLWEIDFVRLVHIKNSDLNIGDTFAYPESENNSLTYVVFSDSNFAGYTNDLEIVQFNLTTGTHNLTLLPLFDYVESFPGVWIPNYGSMLIYIYEISESNLVTISIVDQQGHFIDPRQFRIYVNSERIYSDSYLIDTSTTHNLTITDFWGNILYSNPNEPYERFKDFVFTLYSFKVQNQQSTPIWIELSNNGQTFSEWVFPYEVVEFRVYPATYTLSIYYGETGSDFSVATNGTIVTYSYVVSSDTAIRVTGRTIEDVWGNTLSLLNDLENTNASIHAAIDLQTENITMQFEVTNSNISLIIGNLTIMDSNLEGNFTLISNTLELLDSNLAGNFTFLTGFLSMIDTSILGNTTLITDMLEILDSNLAGNFTATLMEIDLTNSTQVQLIIENYYEILEAQKLAAQYMSELRIETYSVTYSQPYVNVFVETNWKNATITVFLNGTIVANATEGRIFVIELIDAGVWNVTVVISAKNYAYTYTTLITFTKNPVFYDVHINVVDAVGLGLDFDTVAVYANVSGELLRLPQDFTWRNNSLQIVVKDYFDVLLFKADYFLNSTTVNYITINVPIYTVSFENPYNVSVTLTITRGSHSVSFIVPANSTIEFRMTVGTYSLKADPLYEKNEEPKYIGTADTIPEKVISTIRHYTIRLEPLRFTISKSVPSFEFSRLLNAFLITGAILGSLFSIYKFIRYIKAKIEGKRLVIEEF